MCIRDRTGRTKTSICISPAMNSEMIFPTIKVVGFREVRIISVTRFSFSSRVEVSIVLLGNQMLTSTLEEKENRVTEMILTTLNPTTLIIGKVISLFMVGLMQMLIFALPVIIGYLFFRSNLS